MKQTQELLITILRDKNTTRTQFRETTHKLAHCLAHEALEKLHTESVSVQTPIDTAAGKRINYNVVLVPILRSGITLLPAFLTYFPNAAIGVVGLKRDEKTKQAHLYYKNMPPIGGNDRVIILDPMIATGGTALETIKIVSDAGVEQERILFMSVICSPEGLQEVQAAYQNITIIVAAQDKKLTPDKWIFPGLGDFGDRFFGAE